jgi:hypothetical protein
LIGYGNGVYSGSGITVNVGNTAVTVRGVMTDGVFKIGTLFVP